MKFVGKRLRKAGVVMAALGAFVLTRSTIAAALSAVAPATPSVKGQPVANRPLPDQSTVDEAWVRVMQLVQLPHGYITREDLQRALGFALTNIRSSAAGYVTGLDENDSKNYGVHLILLLKSTDFKYHGKTSTVDFRLPSGGCVTLSRARKELAASGLHFKITWSGPNPPSDIFGYPDSFAYVQVFHSNHIGDISEIEAAHMCVSAVRIDGYQGSSLN